MKHGTSADANFLISLLDRCSGNDVMLSATDGEEETFGRALRHNALKERGFPVTVFGAKKTTHNKINAGPRLAPTDPGTKALFEFFGKSTEEVIVCPHCYGRPLRFLHLGNADFELNSHGCR